jgi:ELWxxDGT repeat protein
MIRVSASARAALVLFAVFVCAPSARAQIAYRVKDIGTGSGAPSLGIVGIGAAAGAAYFGTYSQERAYAQLWRTDGTSEGTRPVSDFGSDVADTPRLFTSVPFGAYFFASGSIWRLDASGVPVEIRDLGAEPTSEPAAIGNTIVFVLYRGGDGGGELWRSDGTPEGTARIEGATPDFVVPTYPDLTSAGGRIFFSAYDSFAGSSLWSTDGTSAGTVRVHGLASPPEAASATDRGLLLFIAATDGSRTKFQLWRSDGTASGTFPLRDFIGESSGVCPMSCSPYGPGNLTRSGDRVVFAGNDGVQGRQVWSTDGTREGTTAIAPIAGTSVLPGFLSAGRRVFMALENPEGGTDLWVTDGTASGTVRIAPPGADLTYAWPFAALGDRCVFRAEAGAVWITDGTSAGTEKLLDPPYPGSYPYGFIELRGFLLFVMSGELWRTDGTPSGTSRVGSLAGAASSSPWPAADLSGRLLFLVRQPNDTPAPQATLWVSDGSDAGTNPLATFVRAADGGLVLSRVTPFHGEAYFSADDGVHGTELWKTDGTAAGTRLAADVYPGVGSSGPYELTPLGDRLLFAAWDASGGGLWSTDGTGFERLSTAVPGGELFEPVVLGDAIIYLAFDDAHGQALWRSDGTPAGTYPIEQHQLIDKLARLGDRVYFAGYDGSRWGLWSSDGTPGGARLVREFASSFGYDIVSAGDFVYFTSEGTKLWRSDGTEAGTVRLVVLGSLQAPVAVGRDVFFAGDGGTLWTSDGTEAGTRMVSGFPRVGQPGSYPAALAAVRGALVFSASDGVHGYEPWVSDGTAEGTRMLADVAPGLPSSGPQLFTQAGGLVYFSADDGVTGRELWAIPVDAIASSARTPRPVARPPAAPRGLPPRP